eukprot:TRINITY_DN7180_c0_g2_i5.p1 TRINITY_DN7180_c0_g2~~TRINITY_DN7180_c0_g2_i5.p1  ORF type:complete len:372 (-),score=13.03 TRINITY_DN7180_c0_g2_i5:310-1425(-)
MNFSSQIFQKKLQLRLVPKHFRINKPGFHNQTCRKKILKCTKLQFYWGGTKKVDDIPQPIKLDEKLNNETGNFLYQFGAYQDSLRKALKKCPQLFETTPYEIGLSILELKNIGVSNQMICQQVIPWHPEILLFERSKQLGLLLVLFQKYGYQKQAEIIKFGMRWPQILSHDISLIQQNLQILNEYKIQLEKIIAISPLILCFDSMILKERLFFAKNFVQTHSNQHYQSQNIKRVQISEQNTGFLQNNMLYINNDQIFQKLIQSCPQLLAGNFQDLQQKINFLSSSLQCGPQDLIDYPLYLQLNLEVEIQPRYEFAKQKNVLQFIQKTGTQGNKKVELRKFLNCSQNSYCEMLGLKIEDYWDFVHVWRNRPK